jgi:UDP-glucose:(heptosyl)LPS alpha-1,3-glucosyltransferase
MVAAVSHMVRDDILRRHTGMHSDRVEVIYNRPDLSRFHAASEKRRQECREELAGRFGIALGQSAKEGQEPVFAGTASTNFLLKGLGPLTEAMALLPFTPHLFVAGGRQHGTWLARAEKLGLAGHVHFCGKVEDMPAFYQALDIFVLPTFYDACSNAVLEAMASGCRVLSSSSNGAAFFLDPASVLPDPADVRDMAQRMHRLLQAPPPPPFVWPADIPAGVEGFLEKIDALLSLRRTDAGE